MAHISCSVGTTLSKANLIAKRIWKRFALSIGLAFIWLFAWVFLLGYLGGEGSAHAEGAQATASNASLLMASQTERLTSRNVLSETEPLASMTAKQEMQNDSSPRKRSAATDLCGGPQSVAGSSLGVSNEPSSSETGNELVFWSTGNLEDSPDIKNPDGNLEIFWGKAVVVNQEDTFQFTQVTSSTGSILGGFNLAPVISADGKYIAFFSDRDLTGENGDENFEIFWAELNKATGEVIELIQVTKSSEETGGGSNILPSISVYNDKNGNNKYKIIFVSDNDLVDDKNRDNNQEIFVAELEDGTFTIKQITETTDQINDQPVISPDGNAVVFTQDDGQLYFTEITGTLPITPTRITTPLPGVFNEQPAISSIEMSNDDEYNIAFVSNRPNTGTLNIWLARVGRDQSVTLEPITNNSDVPTSIDSNALSEQPSISADGVRIAFASTGNFAGANPNQTSEIFVYDSEAQSFRQLTEGDVSGGSNNQPSISQNGTQVAFISQGTLYQTRCPFADLEVQLEATGVITAGELLNYEIRAINNGPLQANGVRVTETVPVNTVFNEMASDERWDCDDQSPAGEVCTLLLDDENNPNDDLDPEVSIPVNFAVTVLSNVLSDTQLINSVGIAGAELDRQLENNSATITDTNVIRDTELSIETTIQTVSDGQVVPDERLTYTLAIENIGSSDATNVYLTDTIPLSTTFIDASHNGQFDSALKLVTWEPFTVSADTTEMRKLILQLQTPVLADVTMLTNTVAGFGLDDQEVITDMLTTTVEAEPELELIKSDNVNEFIPGEPYVYTLKYFNNGNQDATNVVITETVPVNTSFDQQNSDNWSCVGTQCTFEIPALRGGGTNDEVSFPVTVDYPVPAGAHVITNTAGIDDDRVNSDGYIGDSVQITTTLNAEPDLQVNKDDNGFVPIPGANDTITYTLTYTNAGDQGATGVVLTETVPEHTIFSGDNWDCDPDNNDNSICTFEHQGELTGDGTPNFTGTVDFAVTVDYPLVAGVGDVTNRVSIADDGDNGDDQNPDDNLSPEVITVINAAPDLQVTKNDNDEDAEPDDEINYTLIYSNTGNQDTSDVELIETVPDYTIFNSTNSTLGWGCEPNNNAGSTCVLELGGILEVGESDSATFAVTMIDPVPDGAELIINTASITDNAVNGADLDLSNNNAAPDINTLIATPDLTLSIDDNDVIATPNNTTVYTLAYANVGNQEATGVRITQTVPANTSFNPTASHPDWSCPNNNPGTECTFFIGSLMPPASGVVTFALRVDYPVATDVVLITNSAIIGDNGNNGDDTTPADNSDSEQTPVDAEPELQVSKDDAQSNVEPTDIITYTLTYTNTGDQNTRDVVLSEIVPDYTTFNEDVSTLGWSCLDDSPAGTSCEYDVASLFGDGGNNSVTFGVTVIPVIPAGVEQITNTTIISDNAINGPDPDLSNNNDDDIDILDAFPNLQLSINGNLPIVEPSQSIIYTLTYTNAGNQGATGVVITEIVPDHTIFAGGTSGWSCANGGIAGETCTFQLPNELPGGGGSGIITFTVTVDSPIANGVIEIENNASIADDGTNGPDSDPIDNDATPHITPVDAQSQLQLTKSDGGITIEPAQTIFYTLTYSNDGNQDATGVTITETVPAHTTFSPPPDSTAGWDCQPDDNAGSTCTYDVGSLIGGGTSGSVIFAVTVDNPVIAGLTQIANSAIIADDGGTGTVSSASASDNTPVDAAPDLAMIKFDGGFIAQPGDIITYTLAYANIGNQGATGVLITETVPAHTTFNEGASTGLWSCGDGSLSGSICTQSIDLLTGSFGSNVTFAVTVTNPIIAGVELITNTASMADDGANGVDSNLTNNSNSEPTPIDAEPNLGLSKDDGGITVEPDGVITYTLTYSNTGDQDATGVIITETVPAYTIFDAAASDPLWACSGGGAAGSICTYNVGDLIAGTPNQSVSFAVRVVNPILSGVDEIDNTASIADDGSNGDDPDLSDNMADESTPVDAQSELQLTKSDGGITVVPSGRITYTLFYSNTGNQGATGVVLTETVPTHTTFVDNSVGWSCANNAAAGSICTYAVGAPVESGQSGMLTFTVEVLNPVSATVGFVMNMGRIGDDDTANAALAMESTPIDAEPNMRLSKTDGGTAVPGGTILYLLTYYNDGNQEATGIVITETVPAYTLFDSASSNGTWSCADGSAPGTICTQEVGDLAGGGTDANVTFAVTLTNPIIPGLTVITNTASVADDGTNGVDPNLTNNSDSEPTTINAQPNLVLTKDDGGITVEPDGVITYTLTYSNDGDQHATGVIITETVPVSTTYNATASGNLWGCSDGAAAGSTCIFNQGVLTAGAASQQVRFAVTVDNPVLAGLENISNSATIADDGSNSNALGTPITASDSDTTDVIAEPNLALTKSDGGVANVVPGERITYTLSYDNIMGNQGATGVVLTETVPANTTFVDNSVNWNCADGASAGTDCSYDAGTMESGDSGVVTFTVQVVNPLAAGVDVITNTAGITDDGNNSNSQGTPITDSASDTTNVIAVPELELSKDDQGATALPGNPISYLLTFTNTGNQDATGIILTETVPADTTFTGPAGWTCAPDNSAGSTCLYTMASLAGGGTSDNVTFEVVISPTVSGTGIDNTASIADDGSNGADPIPGNNTATETTSFLPDLALSKDDGGITASPGDTITYTLTYTNVGNLPATGVILTETVPANTTFNTVASLPTVWSCGDNSSAGTICNSTVVTVATGGTGNVTFAVTITDPVPANVDVITNTASIGDGIDTNLTNNTATDDTPLQVQPDLELSKDDGVPAVAHGELLTYTLTITNTGDGSATGITLTDTLPISTTFDSASDGGMHNAGVVTWPTFDLASALTTTRTLTVIVTNTWSFTGTNYIVNQALVADDGSSMAGVPITDTTTLTTTVLAPLSFSSTPNPALPIPNPNPNPNPVSDTISIANPNHIIDLNVAIVVTHTRVSDLRFTLEHPSGITMTLMNLIGSGCDNDNIDTILDDEATSSILNPCPNAPAIRGILKPTEALNTFDNISLGGTWVLTVSDNTPGAPTGTLVEWRLLPTVIPPP